jgi:cold shock CspA family protein
MFGTVKMINHDKRYGFIRANTSDYFFHSKDCVSRSAFDHLTEGHEVTFSPLTSEKGPRAADVQVMEAR